MKRISEVTDDEGPTHAELVFGQTRLVSISNDAERSLPEMACELSELKQIIGKMLSTLTPREEKIIRLRFGIGIESGEWTREEIGRQFDVTRERIKQIEAKALHKLRSRERSDYLCPFLLVDDKKIRSAERRIQARTGRGAGF